MPIYRVGKEGRPGTGQMEFSSDKEFKKFCKKHNLIGYKGNKEPFSKKEWLYPPKKLGCPLGSQRVKGRCRSIKKMTYHDRTGNPIFHQTVEGRIYIMVRHPSGRGVKRLYLVNGKIPKKHIA